MAENVHPEFKIDLEVLSSPIPDTQALRDDSVLGLREKLDYYYHEFRKLERKADAEHAKFIKENDEVLLDMIGVADLFEDTLRTFKENEKLKEHAEFARDCLETIYDALKDALKNRSVHIVPVKGKSYWEVEFNGVSIPQPFEVKNVGRRDKDTDEKTQKKAQEVRLPLWVRMKGGELKVLRKATVLY